ncbi:MAG: hypothetical protein IPL71_23710 [Anaerolineales bacterium]|uniref:hypothetical protein n=1 Tax=Candidatus Villigracilis proximus TaxID=3140683 RepID=UPI003136A3F0|nr:hypothetical protein [Anaerolineales bacterium]
MNFPAGLPCGVIHPDLTPGLQWVFRHADNDRGLPICLAGEVARVGRDNGRYADICPGENIEAGVAVTGAERIVPDKADQAVRGENEWGVAASRSRSHHQIGS